MKKIGFIDYYLNEWHADHYPAMIEKATNGEYKVCYAYGHIDPPAGGWQKSNAQWAKDLGIELLDTIEEVVEKSDCLIVLSPDNPEMHELLCELPLKSGKRTCIDKTFAPDKETAMRIFANAEAHNTPCFSTSSLRFASELKDIDTDNIYKIYSEGPNDLPIHLIHQLEIIVSLMKCKAKRVMFLGDEAHPSMIIEFIDGRYTQLYHRNDNTGSFRVTTVDANNFAKYYDIQSDYFGNFIKEMIKFFETGVIPVPHEQTIDIMDLRATAIQAVDKPFEWVEL